MRVVAGVARSLKLCAPEGMDTRPTSDRTKETLFNVLQDELPDCNFLDLFSGSGAIGIEALSRGAKRAVFVENSKTALACIESNLEHTKFVDKSLVLRQDVFVSLQFLEFKETFDVVFMDPPYNKELEQRVLEYLTMSSIITQDTLIVVEAALNTDFSYLSSLGYEIIKEKKYKNNKHVFIQKGER